MPAQNRIYLWVFLIFVLVGGGIAAYYGLKAESPTPPAQKLNTSLTSCGTLPLDVELVIDRSASMIDPKTETGTPPQTRLYYAEQAADSLIDQLVQNGGVGGSTGINHVGVTSFGGIGDPAKIDVPLGAESATYIKGIISTLVAGGGTPFREGMATAASDLSNRATRRVTLNGKNVQHVMIFLSDGSPDPDGVDPIGQRPTPNEITQYLSTADVAYAVAIGQGGTGGQGVDLNLMKSLAKPSTAFEQVSTADQLPTLFSTIFTQIECQSADLALTKTVSNAAPAQNASDSFTLTLTNNGPNDATGITVQDTLPAGLTYVAGQDSSYDGNVWTVGDLKSGASDTLTINATVTAAPSTAITNTATITASNLADPNSANNTASATLTVAAATTTPTQPSTPAAPVTPPAAPTTPAPTAPTTPTAAPATGLGGWGQLIYGFLALLALTVTGLVTRKLVRNK